MNPWLAISMGLLLGQTPPVTPLPPPDADTQDPAALELRDAWERALEEAEATDVGQGQSDEILLPQLEVGTPDSPITVPVPGSAPLGQRQASQAPGTGGAGTADTEATAPETTAPEGTAAPAPRPPPTPANLQAELERLRAQVQALQAQQQEGATRTESIQQDLTGMAERAQELERLRTERLELLERAADWVLAADQALAVGELDIGDALGEADSALNNALQNAADAGSGQTVVLVESIRTRLASVAEAVGRRDVYAARWTLYSASFELREARRHAFDQSGASVVIP